MGQRGMTMELIWILGVLAGHTILLFAVWGRLTALDLPRRLHDAVEGVMALSILVFPIWLVWDVCWIASPMPDGEITVWSAGWPRYDYFCLLVLGYSAPAWFWQRWRYPSRGHVASRRVYRVDREIPGTTLCHGKAAWAAHVPGNQILDLEVNEKRIPLARMSPSWEGFTLVHLSDFHFTGQLDRAYYEFVIEQANQLQGDLIVFTGDILDEPACLEWFPAVFGRLKARHGTYAILGNHDKRLGDVRSIERALASCGVQYLGGSWKQVSLDRGSLLLVGNESPWLPAPQPAEVPALHVEQLRVLLSHSPDELAWARRHHFDLVLAGHTHGGQVRLPVVGPVLAPSRFGTRYASGLFHEHPTWMHVSRGVAGAHPLRIDCRPEVTRLVLTREEVRGGGSGRR